ncbi:COG3014 family protein [Poriferisphaera sp. WC338]|uniref:COG3014 family protein n=1 Tax=Poriferisphaera sp. WC338 TaxID=3425129 RepID=UPI003D818C16
MNQLRITPFLLLIMMVISSVGCSNTALRQAQDAYRAGDLVSARNKIDGYSKSNEKGRNAVIAWMEKGTIYRALGDVEASNEAFANADEQLEHWDEQPEFKAGQEGAALLTNLNMLPYRGYNYDRIMLNTYRALNFMQLGDLSAARVELIRAYNRQQEAVERNAKRLEKASEAAQAQSEADKKNKQGANTQKTIESNEVQGKIAENFAKLKKYKAFADYVNPFSELLQGVYFMHAAADTADLTRAELSLQRVAGMLPNNPYVKEDLNTISQLKAGSTGEPLTYIFFETGVAPSRKTIRIDLPLFLVNREVDYVGMAFPMLEMHENYTNVINVSANGRRAATSLISDMDSIVAQEFMNELPLVITKTVMSSAAKAAAAWGIKQAAKGDNAAQLIAIISTTAYQVATNEADLRTWAGLPKQFQYARVKTPANRSIQLSLGGGVFQRVQLDEGKINVVYVKSIAAGLPPIVSQFKLK